MVDSSLGLGPFSIYVWASLQSIWENVIYVWQCATDSKWALVLTFSNRSWICLMHLLPQNNIRARATEWWQTILQDKDINYLRKVLWDWSWTNVVLMAIWWWICSFVTKLHYSSSTDIVFILFWSAVLYLTTSHAYMHIHKRMHLFCQTTMLN